jgi:DHA2 family multidrug resistance protein
MLAGLNNRVGGLALADVRGARGLGFDDGSWLSSVYAAGEVVAMPFATWFAVTLSLRRFHLMMLGTVLVLAAILPLAQSLPVMATLRALQGVASGALIPMLMMAALRFLPLSIRLHGLALYSMTATLAPNLAIWLAGQWTDQWLDWRLVYWHVIPIGLVAMALVAWGIPAIPPVPARFKTGNWFGMSFGIVGLALLAVGLDQGGRLDWFNSPLVCWTLASGLGATALYLVSEWFHPAPFIKLQLLGRRNLAIGFTLFTCLLTVLLSGSALPAGYLGTVQGYRALQTAPIGLMVGLPQLLLAPVVALLLYRKWIDARLTLSAGLALIALACLLGSRLEESWMWREFLWVQVLECIGQPLAVISMLFLCTSVVQPMEGPYISGTINTLRALGTVLGSALVSELITQRGRFHGEMLLDTAGRAIASPVVAADPAQLAVIVHQQGFILATADAYRLLGIAALLLVPLALAMQFIPAPVLPPAPPKSPASHG